MNCPRCNVKLLMTEKKDIEIDYCPECRGIWLDRGELEKLIERSVGSYSNESYSIEQEYRHKDKDHDDDDHDHKYNHQNYSNQYGQKRKKGFLSELFDF